ncbi:putative membrane protein [Collimonas arenae]|uniref:Putative membrane protein n=1 Tax=Collimonas arenae TaxID=279058 RepID=A0A127QGL1_9BURK|nr:sodium:proton antiporter [Collimonas arenae]AMP09116.1 putative membrane protein [Collimonas arenae]
MHKKILVALSALLPLAAQAAELDGAQLAAWWGVPFIGLLLSIALGPLLAPAFWHDHFGKIAVVWSLAFLIPCAMAFGVPVAAAGVVHAFLAEYFPFIILLTALFVVAGGICLRGHLRGTPAMNTGLLALGTVLASLMGTTGAAMLLIRPVINANENRKHTVHIVVFFIFLVANAGGALTPLGDPPLFLGFLKGVDFSWTFKNIFGQTMFMWGALLIIFYLLDNYYFHTKGEELPPKPEPGTPGTHLHFEGKFNFVLLAVVVALVLMSGFWKPGVTYNIYGTEVELQNLLRDGLLVVVVLLSLWLTPKAAREGNDFTWGPILEVAKLFAGIFVTIAPVIAMLRAGELGAFGMVVRAVTGADGQPDNAMYFWATGVLSSFLDNAPTYLVFFNTASGNAAELMTTLAATLAAISCGAVFMGANSYIGNAPNLMVKAIAEERGIRMPSFFGYMAWACVVLLPLFVVMTFIFFR